MDSTAPIIENSIEWPEKYFQALSAIVSKPRLFFKSMPQDISFYQPLKFLFISSAIMAGASLTQAADNNLLLALIRLVNALFMPIITAGIAFPLALFFMGRNLSFARILSIYAYASGVVVLVAWLPAFTWFAESVKWILIGLGLIHGLQMGRLKALLVIITSIAVTAMFITGLTAMTT